MSEISIAMNKVLLIILFSGVSLNLSAQGLGQGTIDNPITNWQTADPVDMGLDTIALNQHKDLCKSSAAVGCIVIYKGMIVQEYKDPSHDFGPYMGIASATKSITSLLTGMLLDDGKLNSIDDSTSIYLPEWSAGTESGVTIRHLLSMSSGLGRYRPFESVLAAKNMTDFVLNLSLENKPGEKWVYSNEGIQLLSPLLEKAAGMPLSTYARERLFDPLDMFWSFMHVDEYYNTVTYGGMETTLREFARVGQLINNGGIWNGEQIISKEWIRKMSTPTQQNPGYGLLWWLFDEGKIIVAAGDGDRVLIIMPEHNLVAVRLQRIASIPGTYSETYFNDRGRMHGKAVEILKKVSSKN